MTEVICHYQDNGLIISLERDGEIFDTFDPIGNELLESLFRDEIKQWKRHKKIEDLK